MYLLENTPEAQVMRNNIKNLLQNPYKQSILSALQFIEKGGFHEDFIRHEKPYVLKIVNVFTRNFLKASLKYDDKFIVETHFFKKEVIQNLPRGTFKFIYGKVVVSCYEDNPCFFKYFAYFFLACENVNQMTIHTVSHTHESMLSIIKFILQDSNVTINHSGFLHQITISRN